MSELPQPTSADIKQIAKVLRSHYIDEAKAKKLAEALEEFVVGDSWQRYLKVRDPYWVLWRINSLFATVADDAHLSLRLSDEDGSNSFPGMLRATEHYLWIVKFTSTINHNVRRMYLDVMSEVKSPLIIDLRDCSGGSTELAYFFLCFLFSDDVTLFELHTRNNPPQVFKSASRFPYYPNYDRIPQKYTGEIKVIVNNRTASAGELIAFVIKSKKRGKIYGARTAGHGHAMIGYQLGNLCLNLPYSKLVDPDTGKNWEGEGVEPDYDILSEEYIKLLYDEIAPNRFTPGIPAASAPNPFRVEAI